MDRSLALDLLMVKLGSKEKELRRLQREVAEKRRVEDDGFPVEMLSWQINEARSLVEAVRAVREERVQNTALEALRETLNVIEGRAESHRARGLHWETLIAFDAARIVREFMNADGLR